MCATEGGVTRKLQQNVTAVSMGEVGWHGGRKPFSPDWKVTMGQPPTNDQTTRSLSCLHVQESMCFSGCYDGFFIHTFGNIKYSFVRLVVYMSIFICLQMQNKCKLSSPLWFRSNVLHTSLYINMTTSLTFCSFKLILQHKFLFVIAFCNTTFYRNTLILSKV